LTGLAPWGPRGGGSNRIFEPPSRQINVSRIVYLCDASGSMMNKFDTLRIEMRKSIESLRPAHGFDVIFFQGDHFLALDKELLLAVPENKRKAFDFIDVTATRDSSDPIPGLRAAFATKPELIYMLTDGDFPNNNAVLEEIRRLNAAKSVRINTIAFMDRGEEYEKLLRTIAEENGGVFKFISDTDLRN
jgi:hypothetical protein